MAPRKPAASHRTAQKKPPHPPEAPVLDARVARSKERVLRTTFELLVERGMGSASVDEVSARSGVAKTTIYRHWRTRADLVFEACTLVAGTPRIPDTGKLETDLLTAALGLARALGSEPWSQVLPSVVDAAERDRELADANAQRQRNQSIGFLTAIQRGKDRGELPASVDAPALVSRLVGPLFYRRWFTREPLDDAYVKALVKSVLKGL